MLIDTLKLTSAKIDSAEDLDVFKSKTPEEHWSGLITSKRILDQEDGIYICESCSWEIVEGHCVNCENDQESMGLSSEGEEEEEDRPMEESSAYETGDDQSVEYDSI